MKGKKAQREGSHYRVALLIETSQEFGREILRGIRDYEQALTDHWSFYLQPDGLQQRTPRIGSWRCTGIIARPANQAMARSLQALNLPLVLLDPNFGQISRRAVKSCIPIVTTNTSAIVEMAFKHLHACGCRNFAFVHTTQETVWSTARAQAFHQLVTSHGYTCHTYQPPNSNISWEDEMLHLGTWLAKLPQGLGVFAAMDQRGRHIIEACREKGIRVPDDLLVLSVDNDPLLCELCEPSLSSIALDAYRAGYEAARVLHHLMRSQPAPGHYILVEPTHVARRQSTSSGVDEDIIVARARRYIFDRLSDPTLQITDIATECGVSRRLLETRFRHSVGRTLLQELLDIRMERARTLLRDTSQSVTLIAAECGFSDANYFTKAFRQRHKIAPMNYRSATSQGHYTKPD